MSPVTEQIYHSALTSTDDERFALIEALLDVQENPPTPELVGDAYLAELQRRSNQSGEGMWSKWEDARQRVHARLGIKESGSD